MTQLVVDVNHKGKPVSAYVEGPFDEGLQTLTDNGYSLISLEQNARLRMQEGASAYVSRNGNWVREGVIYVPKKGSFLTKKSPILAHAKEATDCHRNGEEFYLTREQAKGSLEGSVPLSDESVPTNRFNEDPRTVYAFGKVADDYGKFLRGQGITEMLVYLTSAQDKPFARQLWFGGLDCRSDLDGYYRGLCGGRWVRGVRNVRATKNSGSPKSAAKALDLE